MEGVMYDSVMSFPKVPCTPVTGAYASFYDVFGDVDRIGSGNRDDEVEETKAEESRRRSCSCKYKQNLYSDSDPYIVFLQENQVKLLGALHEEVRILKHENAELKFQIHVILSQRNREDSQRCSSRSKTSVNTLDTSKVDTNSIGPREKTLELELESASKMIEELKWVQQHYEKKIRMQEIKIDGLQRQLQISSNDNIKMVPVQVMNCNKMPKSPSNHYKSGRQRSSSMHQQRELTNRRNSLQSFLPNDYKEQVATLPPILANCLSNSEVSPRKEFSISSSPPSPLTPIQRQKDCGKSRKSAHLQPSSTSVLRSNTPLENPGQQHKGEAQFYFSK